MFLFLYYTSMQIQATGEKYSFNEYFFSYFKLCRNIRLKYLGPTEYYLFYTKIMNQQITRPFCLPGTKTNFIDSRPYNQGISTWVEARIHDDMSFSLFQLFSYLLILIVEIYTCMGFFLKENGERSVLLPLNISSNEHV